MAVCHIAYADLLIRGIQNIGAVAAGIHPCIYHGLWGSLAIGNVFTGRLIGEAEGLDHLERTAVGGTGVREIAIAHHVLRLIAGDTGKLPVCIERRKPVLHADFVDKTDHFILKGRDGGINLRNSKNLSRVDQIGVGHLWIGVNNFAGANLILHGQLPHCVPACDGMGKTGGRDGGDDRCGHEKRRKGGDDLFHEKTSKAKYFLARIQ